MARFVGYRGNTNGTVGSATANGNGAVWNKGWVVRVCRNGKVGCGSFAIVYRKRYGRGGVVCTQVLVGNG